MNKKNKNLTSKKKRGASRIVDTRLYRERGKDAEQLEAQRLSIQRELEEAMAEYAKITGYNRLKARQYKVGDAPNDWRKR